MSDVVRDNDDDPDFDPLDGEDPEIDDGDDEQEEGLLLNSDVSPEAKRRFLVSKTQLSQLLQNCYVCGSLCDSVVIGVRDHDFYFIGMLKLLQQELGEPEMSQ